jgi:hypothetical protein
LKAQHPTYAWISKRMSRFLVATALTLATTRGVEAPAPRCGASSQLCVRTRGQETCEGGNSSRVIIQGCEGPLDSLCATTSVPNAPKGIRCADGYHCGDGPAATGCTQLNYRCTLQEGQAVWYADLRDDPRQDIFECSPCQPCPALPEAVGMNNCPASADNKRCNDLCTQTCSPGYQPTLATAQQPHNWMCSGSGFWKPVDNRSDSELVCELADRHACSAVPPGQFMENCPVGGSWCTAECKDGYEPIGPIGSARYSCVIRDGSSNWELPAGERALECQPKRCRAGLVPTPGAEPCPDGGTFPMSECQAQCRPGYEDAATAQARHHHTHLRVYRCGVDGGWVTWPPGDPGLRCVGTPCEQGLEDEHAECKPGAASVASLLTTVCTEIYLCNVCSCQEILRRNGRG